MTTAAFLRNTAAATAVTRTNLARSSEFRWTKHGKGHIEAAAAAAAATGGETRLTHISHQAPARCIPLKRRTTTTTTAAGAICVLSNYGGGMVQGDCIDWNIRVQPGARLGLTTQGASRIYKHHVTEDEEIPCSETTFHARIDANALLVHAPDPVSCFQNSRYRQTTHIQLLQQNTDNSQTASLCWMDWFSAGRVSRGEQWQHLQLENYTTVEILENNQATTPVLTCHDNTVVHAQHMGPFTAFGTLLLYGSHVEAVLQQCLLLSSQLVNQQTRIRPHPLRELRDKNKNSLPFVAGKCVVGVNSITPSTHSSSTQQLHVVRFLTQSNEDMYRLLHVCFKPLESKFQYAFYQDRLQSQHSAPIGPVEKPWQVPLTPHNPTTIPTATPRTTTTAQTHHQTQHSQWMTYVLADSCFPIGGFAYSSGLEAAHQLGLLASTEYLEAFIHAVVHSTLHLTTPLLRASHVWASNATTNENWDEYTHIQAVAHAHLCSNEIACRVSLDQGRNLLRVFSSWKDDDDLNEQLSLIRRMYSELQSTSNCSHVAPIWGVVTAILGISQDEACQLMGYSVARDLVSAAVRLNLLGPLQSTQLLARVHSAVNAGVASTQMAGCSPLVDAVQPCHTILSTRLFRS